MIRVRLPELLAGKEESLNACSMLTGVNPESLRALNNGTAKGIHFATIEALLRHFKVTVAELFDVTRGEAPDRVYDFPVTDEARVLELRALDSEPPGT